ncbi:hypothetical protein [Streptomyces sp. NPDC090036]|uniref:hypothetical protein n=1 Tax=Streptomyces sp. NPDC090036 TaxID=3365926 RepID=UPI00380F34EB
MDTRREGMLHLKVLHSPHAHARIVSIDKTAALAVPGVHRVYTWEDVRRTARPAASPPTRRASASPSTG